MSYSLDYTDFAFGDSAWEKVLSSLKVGDTLSAAHLLAALEGENEDTLEDAFQHLEDLSVTLDISDLPRGDSGGELAVRLRREEQLVKQGTLLQSLEETDPLRLYLEELAGLPVCGDLSVLAEELEQANREEAEKPELWTAIVNLSLSAYRPGRSAAGSDAGGQHGPVAESALLLRRRFCGVPGLADPSGHGEGHYRTGPE